MRDNQKFTNEEILSLFKRYENGESIQSLAAELGLKPNSLTCKFKNLGCKKAYRSPNSHIPFEEIYLKHQNGIQYKELCIEYGIPYKNLTYALKKFEFTIDKTLAVRVELEPLWERYNSGEQLKDIAEEARLSPKELSRRFSTNGYKKNREIDNYNFDEIEKLRVKAGGLSAVAEMLNLNLESLKRWYYNRGLSIRGYKLTDENYFAEINTPDKAYFLGFIYADGYLHEKKKFFRIKINVCDIKILEHLADLLFGPNKVIPNWKEAGRDVCAISISNPTLVSDLIKWGVHQRKSLTIKFPEDLPKDMIRHFIRGFFDGDGSVSKVKSGRFGNIICVSFSCGSEDFIMRLRDILIIAGFHPQKVSKARNCYSLAMGRKIEMLEFRDYLYSQVDSKLYLDRKYQKFQDIDNCKNNPQIGKFSESQLKLISIRLKKAHQAGVYDNSRGVKCEITDHTTGFIQEALSIKKACSKLEIPYSAAVSYFRKHPGELFMERYSIDMQNNK